MREVEGDGPLRAGRRRVLAASAWTVPAVLAVAPAPAFAASSCLGVGNCPDLSFGSPSGTSPGLTYGRGSTTAGSWTFSADSTGWSTANQNDVGFMPNATTGVLAGKGIYFAASAEPTTTNRVLTLTQSGAVPLRNSCSYVIRYGIAYWATPQPDLVMNILVGSTVVGSYTTAGKSGTPADGGMQSVTVPAGATGVVSFRFLFPNVLDNIDDLFLYSPSITCS